jgi:stage IV sporulation protein FA
MDSKNSIRHRRKERIRRIIEQTEQQRALREPKPMKAEGAGPQQAPQPFQPPFEAYIPPEAPGPRNAIERDPERLWKSRQNPWESAGWRLAPTAGTGGMQGDGGPPRSAGFIVRGLFIQSAIAAALFGIIYGMFRIDTPLAKQGQEVVTAALTDQIDFASAAAWYRETFAGAPSFIPLFGEDNADETKLAEGKVEMSVVKPLKDGTVVRSFAETLGGVEIAGKQGDPVLAAETGRVLLATEDDKTGQTVVIQHANNRVTVYGRLGELSVAANDWVEAGQPVGTLGPESEEGASLLFFAVKEKGRYVDPADVVPLD